MALQDFVLPQLYRRLLFDLVPSLDFAADQSPAVGTLEPPIVGETWKTLFEKLVLTRRNVSWRPVATILDPISSSSDDATVSSALDEEISTSAPKQNQYFHMPLPDNYDTQDKPVSLPGGFEWVHLDMAKHEDLKRASVFLDANALQDQEEQFKLGWTVTHFERQLRCVITPNRAHEGRLEPQDKPIILAVQTNGATGPKNLVAFIAAIPVHLRLWSKVERFYLVRQLCVHRKMRGHRVARVIVKELSRRVHHQPHKSDSTTKPAIPAIFTLGVPMPFRLLNEFGAYHRTLQYQRFLDAGLKPTIDPKDVSVSHFKLLPNLRPMRPEDLHIVFPFVSEFLERFKAAISYTGAEFAHRYASRPGYTYSYVLWNHENTKPIGFFSISELHYNMLFATAKVKDLKIGYVDIVFPVANVDLLKSMLAVADQLSFDELEIGGNMEHEQVIGVEELRFNPGTGRAFNFLHNWLSDDLGPKDWALSENN
jgi:glycylpeptide N-tetradecanoyltransferase